MAQGSTFIFPTGQTQLMKAVGWAAGMLLAELIVKLPGQKAGARGASPGLEQQVVQPLGPIFLNNVLFFFHLIFNFMSIRKKFT